MSDLAVEITADILSRLSVKSLLQLRCVSKPWCALIDSAYFIKLHLNRSIETNANLSVIYRDGFLYSIDFDLLDHALKLDYSKSKQFGNLVLGYCMGDLLYSSVKLDHPFSSTKEYGTGKEYGTELCGYCNGLLCLSNLHHQHIFLWNFSTRKHHKLPFPPIGLGICPYMDHGFGFGYDSVLDDYKLVRMVQYMDENYYSFYCKVAVYSLKLNSWRRIQDFPYYLRCRLGNAVVGSGANAVFVSGALHWVVWRSPYDSDKENLIAAIDLGVEEYRLVPQPDYLDKNFRMDVGVLGGCLCIICNYARDRGVDVWVMKDYGLKESWTKLFSVEQRVVIGFFDFVRPLVYSKTGGEVLLAQDNAKLHWLDLKRKTVKYSRILGLPIFYEGEICVGSLVPLCSDGG